MSWIAKMAKPIIVHRYFVAFDRKSDRLMFTFAESDWEVSGQQGQTMIANLAFTLILDPP
jgi:hypothetical protein